MTIVCGTDFSTPASEALHVAALLAAALDEPLQLVHVVEDVGAELTFRSRPEILAPVRVELRSAAERARALGARVEEELLPGSATEILTSLGARARLIVVSSLGQEAPARWLLGSVSERVARMSPSPLLVVRDAAPFERWLRGSAPLEVLVGADRSEASDAALRWLAELRRLRPCNVSIMQVARPPAEHDRLGVPAPADDLETLHPDVERSIVRELQAKAEALPGEGELRFVVSQSLDRADRQLVAAAEEAGADLLVVGSSQRYGIDRLWHRSVSRGVLHLASTNVASVPARLDESERRPAPALRRVLAATDFSESGDRAVAFAMSLLPNGGTVHIVHVLSPTVGRTPISRFLPRAPADRAATLDQVRDRLARLVTMATPCGVHVVSDVLEGSVPDELCRTAQRLGIDVICVGSGGRSTFRRFRRSVAREVLAKSRRPVVVVPARR